MKFKIIGNKKINDAKPGEVIEINDELLADSLVAGGHIEKVKNNKKKGGK
tara:strand:+ start:1204 stop:1353 length:150 start_codon:yes stop_codon:yes gene_type:complete